MGKSNPMGKSNIAQYDFLWLFDRTLKNLNYAHARACAVNCPWRFLELHLHIQKHTITKIMRKSLSTMNSNTKIDISRRIGYEKDWWCGNTVIDFSRSIQDGFPKRVLLKWSEVQIGADFLASNQSRFCCTVPYRTVCTLHGVPRMSETCEGTQS